MLNHETQEIDGITFTSNQFPAMRAFTLFGKLAKTIGPALGVLSTADPNADMMTIAPALGVVFRELDPDAATQLALEVLSNTQVTTPEGNIKTLNSREICDQVFMGRFPTLFKAIALAIRVNFGGFFGGNASPAPKANPSAG